MTTTVALAASAVALGLLAVAGGGAGGERARGDRGAASEPRPNVVVIMTDDQRDDDLRVMQTVSRELAAQGVTFERSFVNFPLCCPARASLFTGQYAHNHGVRHNRPPDGGFAAYQDAGSLPIALGRAGYRTGFIGKYLNGYPAATKGRPGEVPDGWDVWHAQLGSSLFHWRLNSNGRIRRFGAREPDYQTDVYARQATRFIERSARRGDPFFLTVVPFAPHLEQVGEARRGPRSAPRHRGAFGREPLPRMPAFNERNVSDKPGYVRARPRLRPGERRAARQRHRARLASLLAVDDLVGEVVRALRKEGELDRTYVIFTSDNGYFLGEHRLLHKGHLYDEAVRVPLVIRGPGLPRGITRSQLVANIDLAPTILGVTGAPELRPADGIDLVSLAQDPSVGRDRDLLLESRTAVGVRTPGWAYVEHDLERNGEPDQFELYDLDADPHQLENLIGPHGTAPRSALPPGEQARVAAQRAQLADRLATLRECEGRSCR